MTAKQIEKAAKELVVSLGITLDEAIAQVKASLDVEIVLPEKCTVLIKITNVSDGQGAKFESPTKVVSFTTLGDNPVSDILFISTEFWNKAKFDSIIFVDNAVSAIVEVHEAGKTGFIEAEGDVELTAHKKDDKHSFVSATHATVEQYFDAMIAKYPIEVIKYFFGNITASRASKLQSSSAEGQTTGYDGRHE